MGGLKDVQQQQASFMDGAPMKPGRGGGGAGHDGTTPPPPPPAPKPKVKKPKSMKSQTNSKISACSTKLTDIKCWITKVEQAPLQFILSSDQFYQWGMFFVLSCVASPEALQSFGVFSTRLWAHKLL